MNDLDDIKWGFIEHFIFWMILFVCGVFMLIGMATVVRWLLLVTTS